jgi:dipeptidyl aminopeptidase/acylaminoacyl peptidase
MKNKTKLSLRIIGYILITCFVVSFAVVYRLAYPQEVDSQETPEDYNLNYENIQFKSRDGLDITGWYIKSFKKQAPTIILMHGYPTNKADMLSEASFLAQEMNILMFDFRGLGGSEKTYSTLGAKEVNDLHGAIDYLKTEKDLEEVSLWGFSMGGAVALQGTAQREEVIAVVSDSSYANLDEMIENYLPIPVFSKTLKPFFYFWSRILFEVNIKDISPEEEAKNIEVPVFLIHAEKDPLIPIEQAEKLEEALSDNKGLKVEFIDSSHHGASNQSIKSQLVNFLKINDSL